MTLNVDENIKLELTSKKQVVALFQAIDNNREHLSTFLPWVDNIKTIENFSNYIEGAELLIQQQKEVSFAILLDGNPVGRIGLHHLNMLNKCAAIGYWLTKEAQGKGIIMKSCEALINYGFQDLGLQRIEIKAAVNNVRSQAIPQKLDFKKEGILRQAELVNDEFLDLVLYSLLYDEYNTRF
ncbi:GNAT family N-acetyltransferase [Pedobacter sp. PAMC26386]|nr:GNAT family N-acetyltransferase [Pedobacter sp. PAMC26386]